MATEDGKDWKEEDCIVTTTDNLTTPCPRHKAEMLKLYCKDHKLFLCRICASQEHTPPCDVYWIPKTSEILNSKPYQDYMRNIDILLRRCTRLKTVTSRDITKSIDSLRNALPDVRKHRKEINNRLDELEKALEDKIQALQHQNDEREKTAETTCADVMKMMKAKYDNMKQLNTSKQANKLYDELEQYTKQKNDYEDSINSLSMENTIYEYYFNPNRAILDVPLDENMIGAISMKQLGMTCTSVTSADVDSTPTFLSEIYVKTSEDKESCNITSMTTLPPNKLVIVDYQNNSIKLVDVSKSSVSSQLSLKDDKAFGISSITKTRVAVTVPDRQQIQFISVSRTLKMQHKIETDGKCYGICFFENKLIVTYQESDKLEILDMNGRVITRVNLESSGEDVNFYHPDNVQANSRCIYVSNNISVIMINWKGEITGTFGDLIAPTAIALLDGESVIVCDDDTDSLYQVSAECTNKGTVLQSVRSPNAVCVDTTRHELYIGRLTDRNDEIDNNILVYNI